MLKSFGGTFNNYLYPLVTLEATETREITRVRAFGNGGKRNPGMIMSAKMYQDVSCLRVRSMGIFSCFECPLPDCQITEYEAQGKAKL